MKVGIVGLGLIGGSLAKAYKKTGHTVFATDIDEKILGLAKLSDIVDNDLTAENLSECDLVLISVLPEATVEYFQKNAAFMSKESIIVDCCGTKRAVCEKCFSIAEDNGLTFVGGHPMAGSHRWGFKNSHEELFRDAPMVLVPPVFDNPELLAKTEKLLKPAGFGKFSVTTAQKHDEMIAFTSQMAHVVSNAYVKSPAAREHKGFSAGSYRDLTRVAWLNPDMWAELFLENSDNLLHELDLFIASLKEYSDAIRCSDKAKLVSLLDEGRKIKENIDSK